MNRQPLLKCIWKGIKWMPTLIYWIWPNGIVASFVFGLVLSIFLWPVWIATAIIITLINFLGGNTR